MLACRMLQHLREPIGLTMGPQLALTIGLTMLSVAGCVHHLTSAQLVARECALSPAESAQRPVEQFEAFLAPVIITDINGPNRMWLDLREANVCRLSHALALPGVASDKRAEVIVAVLQSKEAQLLTKACQEHFGTVLESSAMAAAAPSCAMWQKARVIAAQALAADQRLIETATVQRWLTTRLTTSLKTDVDGWLRRQVNDAEVLAAAVPAAELFVTRLVSGTIEERLLAQRMFDTWSTDFSRLKNALVNDSDTAEVLLMRFRLLVAIPEANEHADIICANSPPPRHGEVLGYLMRSKLCECRPPSLDLSKECIASDAREPASLKSKFRLALEGELAQDHRVAAVFPYLYSEADQLKPASMTALEAWGAYVSLAALATHRNDDIAI